MKKLQEIQQTIFEEIQNIIQELNQYTTKEELLNSSEKISALQEKFYTLKFMNDKQEIFENEYFTELDKSVAYVQHESTTNFISEISIENEYVSTVNDFEEQLLLQEQELQLEKENEERELLRIQQEEEEAKLQLEKQEEQARIQQAEEERRRKIVEFEKTEKTQTHFSEHTEHHEETKHEKKFKLANIKGLKTVQSLFDDDVLEETEQKVPGPSIIKSNIPTDFMEAEKSKPEFKLDLNDKIAFSKMLFGGSQFELNETIHKLNHFKDIEDAKQFLSDEYYKRNWQEVDEYAQRLWSLVENKFL